MAIVEFPDEQLSADGLEAKYASDAEHPRWSINEFRATRVPEDTQTYWQWVETQIHRQPSPFTTATPDGWKPDRQLTAEQLATKHGDEHPHYTHDNWVADVVAYRTSNSYWGWVVDKLAEEPEPVKFSQAFNAVDIAVQCGWRQLGQTLSGKLTVKNEHGVILSGVDAWQQAVWHELHNSGCEVDGKRQKFYPTMED